MALAPLAQDRVQERTLLTKRPDSVSNGTEMRI
jgi:hypothetical protein